LRAESRATRTTICGGAQEALLEQRRQQILDQLVSLDDAAATVLNLSTRLMELPIGVFAIAISTVFFPQIAMHAAAGDMHSLAKDYRQGMRLIILVNVPAAFGLVVLAKPIIRVLFQHGQFNAEATELMIPVLRVSALASKAATTGTPSTQRLTVVPFTS
jgi:peptidoglycan biosynthesis protein MviN/MurJ (putative lipid II flippase)